MTSLPASLRRVAFLGANTLREAGRQKVHLFFLLVALALVVGARWLHDLDFGGSAVKFIGDIGFGAMAFFGATLVITAAAQLFFGEIESRTALTLLAKPVHRAEFILGKLVGVALLAAIFCALVGLVLGGMMALHTSEVAPEMATVESTSLFAGNAAQVAAVTLLQWIRLTVLAAFTLLIASYARTQLFTIAASFLVFVICHAQHLVHDSYARASSSTTRAMAALFSWVFPNFRVFALEEAFGGTALVSYVARAALYGGIYIAAAGGLAILCFRRREI